ncbi:MAG: Endoribonuclease MazF9 [Mycoplasmataceae bacterium]|nr:MAG: Endoribonuclease MazF9 [Mycoplasmataceae bacterium]
MNLTRKRNKKLDISQRRIKQSLFFPQQGEIWLVEFPKIKEFSKPFRPALIISNNLQNEFDKLVNIVNFTTEEIDKIRPFEVFIKNYKETGLDHPSKILAGYSFSLYKERLIERLGRISDGEIKKVKEALKITFDLN